MKLRAHRGFAIITAIFLLVILAAIGVAMVTFSTAQHTTSGQDVMGSRAYQAARAGVEWALYQRLNPQVAAPNVSPAYCSSYSAAGTAVTNSFAMPSGTSLSPFTVTVQCIATSNANASTRIVVRTITACACTQPASGSCMQPAGTACLAPATPPSGPDYIQREVQISMQEPF
jgi:MSHA biogenesis protein MshP